MRKSIFFNVLASLCPKNEPFQGLIFFKNLLLKPVYQPDNEGGDACSFSFRPCKLLYQKANAGCFFKSNNL